MYTPQNSYLEYWHQYRPSFENRLECNFTSHSIVISNIVPISPVFRESIGTQFNQSLSGYLEYWHQFHPSFENRLECEEQFEFWHQFCRLRRIKPVIKLEEKNVIKKEN